MTATAANTEQVFPLQGAKSSSCIISLHPHHGQLKGQCQDPLPGNPKVQNAWKPSVLLKCGVNNHLGAKLTCEDIFFSFFTPFGVYIKHLITRCCPRPQCGCCGMSSQAGIPKHTELRQFQIRIREPILYFPEEGTRYQGMRARSIQIQSFLPSLSKEGTLEWIPSRDQGLSWKS